MLRIDFKDSKIAIKEYDYYVCTLNLNVEDYKQAIDLAPSIKPFRHTYLHEKQYRELAKQILVEDEVLRRVFHLA